MNSDEKGDAWVSAHEAGWILLDQIIKQHDLATACLKIIGQGQPLVEQLAVQMLQKHGFAPEKVKTITSDLIGDIVRAARDSEKNEFWLLCNNTLVAMCGAMESMAKDVAAHEVVTYGLPNPDAHDRKIKITAQEFLVVSPEERARVIVDRVFEEEGTKNGHGSRLEKILAICRPFEVDRATKLAIDEACEIRNAIVHRGARVDRRLAEKAPRFKLELGRSIRIGGEDFQRHRKAIQDFVSKISERDL